MVVADPAGSKQLDVHMADTARGVQRLHHAKRSAAILELTGEDGIFQEYLNDLGGEVSPTVTP